MAMETLKKLGAQFPTYTLKELFDCISKSDYLFEIEEVRGKRILYPQFSWFNTKISDSKGYDCHGTGEHYNKDIAKLKSITESIERYAIKNVKKKKWNIIDTSSGMTSEGHNPISNSNGIAYHTNVLKGLENAILESIERHSILDAWLNKKVVSCLNFSFNKYKFISSINGFLNDLKINFVLIPNKFNVPVVSCIIQGRRNSEPKMLFGYGCHFNINKAIEKSFYEAWRFYLNYRYLNTTNPASNQNKFVEHFNFYINTQLKLEDVFNLRSTPISTTNKDTSSLIQSIKNFKINIFNCEKFNLIGYLVHVESTDLIKLWSGELLKDTGLRKKGEIHPIA